MRVAGVFQLAAETHEMAKAGGDPLHHVAEGVRRLVGADAWVRAQVEMFLHQCQDLVFRGLDTEQRRGSAVRAAQEGACVRAVRVHLAASPASTLREVSQSLGMSSRSLQRQLTGAGSSFRSEVNRTRMEAAKKLLAESELKLTAIALEVGYASSQHFSAQFHRLMGTTPSAWRARARRRVLP